jgi:hypothetical protein
MIAHYLFSENPKFQVLTTLNNRDIDFSVDPFKRSWPGEPDDADASSVPVPALI